MANWENIKSGVSRAANTTIKKTGELAGNASMHMKLARLMSKRDDLFEKLGKLTYTQLKTDESHAEEISAVISQIDTLGIQIRAQKAKIEEAKAEKAREKADAKLEKQKKNVSDNEIVSEVQAIVDESIDD